MNCQIKKFIKICIVTDRKHLIIINTDFDFISLKCYNCNELMKHEI